MARSKAPKRLASGKKRQQSEEMAAGGVAGDGGGPAPITAAAEVTSAAVEESRAGDVTGDGGEPEPDTATAEVMTLVVAEPSGVGQLTQALALGECAANAEEAVNSAVLQSLQQFQQVLERSQQQNARRDQQSQQLQQELHNAMQQELHNAMQQQQQQQQQQLQNAMQQSQQQQQELHNAMQQQQAAMQQQQAAMQQQQATMQEMQMSFEALQMLVANQMPILLTAQKGLTDVTAGMQALDAQQRATEAKVHGTWILTNDVKLKLQEEVALNLKRTETQRNDADAQAALVEKKLQTEAAKRRGNEELIKALTHKSRDTEQQLQDETALNCSRNQALSERATQLELDRRRDAGKVRGVEKRLDHWEQHLTIEMQCNGAREKKVDEDMAVMRGSEEETRLEMRALRDIVNKLEARLVLVDPKRTRETTEASGVAQSSRITRPARGGLQPQATPWGGGYGRRMPDARSSSGMLGATSRRSSDSGMTGGYIGISSGMTGGYSGSGMTGRRQQQQRHDGRLQRHQQWHDGRLQRQLNDGQRLRGQQRL